MGKYIKDGKVIELKDWQHNGCALIFGSRRAMLRHWKEKHV